MGRPEITASNYKAVYRYFEQNREKPRLSRTARNLSGLVIAPEVILEPGVNKIQEQLDLGKRAIIAANHPGRQDAFVLPAALWRTSIPGIMQPGFLGKDHLFRGSFGWLFEDAGGLPVFRRQSYPEIPDEEFNIISNMLLRLAADRIRGGTAMVIMPEGRVSLPENRVNLDPDAIKSGIARVALDVGDSDSFILPIGIHHRGIAPRESRIPPRHPIVAIGEPITTYMGTVDDVRLQVHAGIQDMMNVAYAAANPRPGRDMVSFEM